MKRDRRGDYKPSDFGWLTDNRFGFFKETILNIHSTDWGQGHVFPTRSPSRILQNFALFNMVPSWERYVDQSSEVGMNTPCNKTEEKRISNGMDKQYLPFGPQTYIRHSLHVTKPRRQLGFVIPYTNAFLRTLRHDDPLEDTEVSLASFSSPEGAESLACTRRWGSFLGIGLACFVPSPNPFEEFTINEHVWSIAAPIFTILLELIRWGGKRRNFDVSSLSLWILHHETESFQFCTQSFLLTFYANWYLISPVAWS